MDSSCHHGRQKAVVNITLECPLAVDFISACSWIEHDNPKSRKIGAQESSPTALRHYCKCSMMFGIRDFVERFYNKFSPKLPTFPNAQKLPKIHAEAKFPIGEVHGQREMSVLQNTIKYMCLECKCSPLTILTHAPRQLQSICINHRSMWLKMLGTRRKQRLRPHHDVEVNMDASALLDLTDF